MLQLKVRNAHEGFVAALVVFASMYLVARAHDPLGPLRLIGDWLQ